MNRKHAHAILDAAHRGAAVSQAEIDAALRSTGDAIPKDTKHFGRPRKIITRRIPRAWGVLQQEAA